MTHRSITIIKRDAQNRFVLCYPGELLRMDDELALARCPWPHAKTVDLDGLIIAPGDVFFEFYYLREWFNIMRIFGEDGALKGWYCNIARPAIMSEENIAWSDLALDLLVLPDGRTRVLDEDEFEDLALDVAERRRALAALERLQRWVSERHPPFDLLSDGE